MAAELRLHNSDQVARVDDGDLADLLRWRWQYLNGYVVRSQRTAAGSVLVSLHRYLTQAGPGEQVDHADRDRLNNQRANLRVCTRSENLANRPSPRAGYRGVYFERRGGGWRAQIKVDNKNRYLGTYPTAELAALAYDAAALAAWGRFARVNFPGETPTQLPLFTPETFDPDPFDIPAPARPMDFAEIVSTRRAHTFTGDRATAEALAADLGIAF